MQPQAWWDGERWQRSQPQLHRRNAEEKSRDVEEVLTAEGDSVKRI